METAVCPPWVKPVHPDTKTHGLSVVTLHNNQPSWCGHKSPRNLLPSSNVNRSGYVLRNHGRAESFEDRS